MNSNCLTGVAIAMVVPVLVAVCLHVARLSQGDDPVLAAAESQPIAGVETVLSATPFVGVR